MKRQSLSSLQRLKVFEREHGRCHICGLPVTVGQTWEVEHVRPLALGGADDETNWKVAHKSCHAIKTRTDAGRIAKAKRVKIKHIGAKRESRFPKPPPGYIYDWRQGRYVKPRALQEAGR